MSVGEREREAGVSTFGNRMEGEEGKAGGKGKREGEKERGDRERTTGRVSGMERRIEREWEGERDRGEREEGDVGEGEVV